MWLFGAHSCDYVDGKEQCARECTHTQRQFCELNTHIEGVYSIGSNIQKHSSASRLKKYHMPRHSCVKGFNVFGAVIHLFIQQIFTEHLLRSRRDFRLEAQL